MTAQVPRRTFIAASGAVAAGAAGGLAVGVPSPAAADARPAGPVPFERVPSGLLADLLPAARGIEADRPLLTWRQADLGPGAAQTHYQVQFATSPARLHGGPRTWDSGRVASADSVAVRYGGPKLAARTAYWWRVRTFAGSRVSPWSAPEPLTTGVRGGWTGVPVWVPAGAGLADGTFAVNVTIEQVSAGLWFRAASSSENYLWQVFAGSPGRLRRHVFTGGSFRIIGEADLPMDVPTGAAIDIAVRLSGSTFTTTIGGTVVDTTTDDTHATGTVGLRNGRTESQTYQSASFTDPDGTVVFDDDFATGQNVFGVGTVSGGALHLGHSQSGLAGGYGPDDSWALLRHAFTLPPGAIAAGVLHVAATSPEPIHQYAAALWCNGRRAGFASPRSPDGTVRYVSLDVTGALRPGRRNALAALCYTTDDQRLLAQLEVSYADGRRVTVATGPHWRARTQGGLLADHGDVGGGYYHAPQEYWDMRAEPVGWTAPGYDDSDWPAATARDAFDATAPTLTEPPGRYPVRPARVRTIAAGHYLVDLGREIVGGLALDVTGSAGQTVEVRLGEELSDSGTVRYKLRAGNTYREVWTLRDGRQHVEHWGYRCFRYAELITEPALDLSTAVTGSAYRLPWRDGDAAFHSSDADLDRVYEFCRYSIEATRADLYVDSSTRERGPYEGDSYVNQASEYAVQASYALARYSDHYLVDKPTWPTEYHLMSVLSAWRDYLATGDARQLAADYDALVAKNLTADVGADHLVHKSTKNDLVDWPASNRDGYVFTTTNTVVNAFQQAAYATLGRVAGALGRTSDAADWQARAAAMRAAINTALLAADGTRYYDGAGTEHSAQHATAYPVALGVAPAERLGKLGATLAAGGMRTSPYAAQFLVEALFVAGRADDAIALLTGTGMYSWRHMMDDLGATIVAEAWDPSLKPNMTFSHAWASAPANLIPRYLLGVQVTEPGAAAVEVRPRTGSLARARGTVPTIRGPVSVDVHGGEAYRLRATLPSGVRGRVCAEIGDDAAAGYRVTADGRPVKATTEHDGTNRLLVARVTGPATITIARTGTGAGTRTGG